MPPVSQPFKRGALVVLMNYNDHALPPTLRRMIETWVEAHEEELLEQWDKGRQRG